MRVAGKLDIKSLFAGHLLDDIQLDGGRCLLIVNGEQGYASFVRGNDGVGRDDAGTSRLASSLGRNGHTNLTDAWTKFCTLERVLLKAFLKVLWDLLLAAKI